MSRQLQPPVLSVSLVNNELPTVIKNEPLESEIAEIGSGDINDSSISEEEIIPDVKEIDIVYHPVCEECIKGEILKSKHCESVETQVSVKAANSPFIKTENVTQKNKTEDTSDENVIKGTGQAVVEVQGSNEYSDVLSDLETNAQLVLNFSKDLSGISTRTRKAKQPEKTNFAKCYKTLETISWKKDEEKKKLLKHLRFCDVKPHEYTFLAKDKYVCNHCQHTYKALSSIRQHIKQMHRKLTTMYQCPYCPYDCKSKGNVKKHIIQKHKDTKDIQWFQCNLCEMKFKFKCHLTRHMKVHLTHEQKMQDGLDLPEKRYHCDNCDYKTNDRYNLKRHNLVHLKPEEMKYFYCYHCSYKSKHKSNLKIHIFRQHFKNVKQGKRSGYNKCVYKTYKSTQLNNHKLIHSKSEDIPYFHCYHCSYKSKQKGNLQRHISKHLKYGEVRFDCYICNFMAQKRESIIEHIKKHSKVQIKFEISDGS